MPNAPGRAAWADGDHEVDPRSGRPAVLTTSARLGRGLALLRGIRGRSGSDCVAACRGLLVGLLRSSCHRRTGPAGRVVFKSGWRLAYRGKSVRDRPKLGDFTAFPALEVLDAACRRAPVLPVHSFRDVWGSKACSADSAYFCVGDRLQFGHDSSCPRRAPSNGP